MPLSSEVSSPCGAQMAAGCWPVMTFAGRSTGHALDTKKQTSTMAHQQTPQLSSKSSSAQPSPGRRASRGSSQLNMAYLRDGPGAPFSAAAASLQAPWSAPLPPRDVRGSVALQIAGSLRPRLTLLGRDRGVLDRANVRLAAGDIGTTRADTRTRGGLRAVGCAQTKCKQGS